MREIYTTRIIFFLLVSIITGQIKAQEYDCFFKPPVVKIDFGSGNIPDVNSIYLPKYRRDFTTCPENGHYSFISNTSNCFNGDWLTINEDHTAKGQRGNMMLVNASETGGVFFYNTLNGFTENTTYQFTVWMMNVCRVNGGCSPLPPNITISIITPDGRKAGLFKTGLLIQSDAAQWKKFTGFFQTPAGVTSLDLKMEDETLGGCGNDFAMDDITINECALPKPEVKNVPPAVAREPLKQHPPLIKQTPAIKPAVIKKIPLKINPAKSDTPHFVIKPVAESKPMVTIPVIKDKPVLKVPELIITRANPVAKQIETDSSEILIELYDNGEIDGDTVTVYHNNQLIISRAGLSDKPISFRIKVDKMQPHHELTMVANNLGSIPPNTSMMIITTHDKRYEVFISSSEQENAKVIIDLKK